MLDAVRALDGVDEVLVGSGSSPPAARNAAVEATSGDWVLVVAEACRMPRDFVVALRRAADEERADIVGAPSPPARRDDVSDAHTAGPDAVPTPLLSGPFLASRRVLEARPFDPSFAGNAFRERAAFLVSAMRAGYVCVLTPATASERTGAAPSRSLRDEWWTQRNEWRFLRRHASWLHRHGYLDARSVVGAQLGFAAGRLRP